jgi:hypothetical protein
MVFFRSEDDARAWCERGGHPLRPLVTIPQLWNLASAWYSNRLSPDARRPQPAEMRQIFARIGLTGDFWNPEADVF